MDGDDVKVRGPVRYRIGSTVLLLDEKSLVPVQNASVAACPSQREVRKTKIVQIKTANGNAHIWKNPLKNGYEVLTLA